MTSKENILAGLSNLLRGGSLPKTACSAALLRAVRPLLDADVIVEIRVGGGRRLSVRDATALKEFIGREFPNLLSERAELSRVAGVGRFRDSKTFASDTPEIVSVKVWDDDALVKDGKPIGATRATVEHGLCSFLPTRAYALRGPCAFVENPALFIQLERLRLPVRLAICSGRGRASGRMIDWMAAQASADFALLHLPDYDPVGLLEFTHLRLRLGARVQLHLPDDLAERFKRFSNRALLRKAKTRSMLAELRASELAEVQMVVDLIHRNNGCLEQEALLLDLP